MPSTYWPIGKFTCRWGHLAIHPQVTERALPPAHAPVAQQARKISIDAETGAQVGVNPAGATTVQSEPNDWCDRFVSKTRASRRHRARYAGCLADSRAVAGFKPGLKEVVYPIVGSRADGCRIWDIDGNEYVDLAMGFGVQLFGHGAAFIHDAISAQLQRGLHLGPQAELSGPVAQLICELTKVERVCFSTAARKPL